MIIGDAVKLRVISLLDMPWLAVTEIHRILALPWIRLRFLLLGVPWGRGWRILGMPMIQRHRGSRIRIGDGLVLRSWKSSNPLVPFHPVVLATRSAKAQISIGNNFGMSGGSIVAAEQVQIGNSVLIGANVIIADTDFHPVSAAERQQPRQSGVIRPIVIEDNVFIGANSIILKGVRIGAGSVIGAASVVSLDIPPNVIAAGNPARPLGGLS
jgi:acetyltransferase-like isoleucine patch superfamily enzyme